jgi:hypothetical protein
MNPQLRTGLSSRPIIFSDTGLQVRTGLSSRPIIFSDTGLQVRTGDEQAALYGGD